MRRVFARCSVRFLKNHVGCGFTAFRIALLWLPRLIEKQIWTTRLDLVACSGEEERVVGHAFYVAVAEQRAEVAFTIANDFQGRGLGSILLGQLAEVASANGIEIFEAEVVAANHAMLHVFRASGFPIEVNAYAGQLHVVFPTSFTAEARKQFERRESIAAVNALKLFFEPRAVAVIGASRQRGTIGGEIFHNLLSYGFKGRGLSSQSYRHGYRER